MTQSFTTRGLELGLVVHIYNLSTWEAEVGSQKAEAEESQV